MNRVTFYLQRKRQTDGKSSISCRFTYRISRKKSLRLSYNTNLAVNPTYWDKRRQRVRPNPYFTEYRQLNLDLDRLENVIKDIYREFREERRTLELTTDRFKKLIDAKYWGDEELEVNLLSFLDQHLKDYKEDPDYNPATDQIFSRTRDLLYQYSTEVTKIDFMDVTVPMLKRFVAWLRSYDFKDGKTGYSDNTIIKIIGRVRAFMEAAIKAGATHNRDFREASNKALGLRKTPGDKIYLTMAQLKQFYSYSYERKGMRITVDLFTAASMLGGLRISDWSKIDQANCYEVDGVTLFDCSTKKTNQIIVVPVHPIVKEIFARYEGKPPRLSDQQMNRYLKEAAELAGFTEMRSKRIRKKVLVEEKKPMYKFFTCHVARNNFNSNALAARVPARDVKKFMAHAEKDMTEIYDRRSLQRIALDYADHPFFNEW